MAKDFSSLLTIRQQVLAALEVCRKAKMIGSSLETDVLLRVDGSVFPSLVSLLRKYGLS